MSTDAVAGEVTRDIVVVGASAGGVESLRRLVAGLPADFAGTVLVVLHVSPHGTSVLPDILSRAGPLPAAHAADGERLEPGRILVAPPNRHLLLHDGTVALSAGAAENGTRPAIDVLFRSAARSFGPRVVGVLLSGVLDDGTAGLLAIKRAGGVAIVQDPDEAAYADMPRSAIGHVEVDDVISVDDMARRLVAYAAESFRVPPRPVDEQAATELKVIELDPEVLHASDRPGTPAPFGCPTCSGAMWEMRDGELLRFRCRVGHAWTADGLLAEQVDYFENALWTALRALEERGSLARRLEKGAGERGSPVSAQHFGHSAEDAEQKAEVIRTVLLGMTAEQPHDH